MSRYLLLIIGVILIISLYFNYSLSNKLLLIKDSLKDTEVNCVDSNCNGYRSGILSSIGVGDRQGRWLICYNSLEDSDAGDKSAECCKSAGGTWHDNKCCAPGKDNSGWNSQTGQCLTSGEWSIKQIKN